MIRGVKFFVLTNIFVQVIYATPHQIGLNSLRNEGESSASTSEINGGYWAYLLMFGLWGRVSHHLLTSKEAFGPLRLELDAAFRKQLGDEKWQEIEDNVAQTFPVYRVLHRLNSLSSRVWDVRAPNGKTFGDAIMILNDMSRDFDTVREFVDRLGMIKNIEGAVGRNVQGAIPAKSKPRKGLASTLAQILGTDPGIVQFLLKNPIFIAAITEIGAKKIENFDVTRNLEYLKTVASVLYTLEPRNFNRILNTVLSLQDPATGNSLQSILTSLKRVTDSPKNIDKISNIFKNPDMLGDLELEINVDKIADLVKQITDTLQNIPETVKEEQMKFELDDQVKNDKTGLIEHEGKEKERDISESEEYNSKDISESEEYNSKETSENAEYNSIGNTEEGKQTNGQGNTQKTNMQHTTNKTVRDAETQTDISFFKPAQ